PLAEPGDALSKVYDPNEAEGRWYKRWREAGVFAPKSDRDPTCADPSYVIMMPPPNVTGSLHMGHALTATLQDILIRYHRMLGRDTLYLPGTDHAGIATQSVVERELARQEGKTRHDLGREAFLERVWAWKDKNGSRIVEQLMTLGVSADWGRARFTMDERCSRAVTEAFVRMWDDGLIYRGERLVNWDPKARTALSDEEVEHEERRGELWRFAYPFTDGSGEVVVATTRPETLLGDTAVAVHPDDERYQAHLGKTLRHPFFPERHLPLIADAYVDPAFGTGAVKITPAHDPNDFEMGQRHALPMINIFTLDAHVNERGGEFAGLERYEARRRVKAALEGLGLARGAEEITHNVSVSQRSGEVIEPMLSRQFFVRTQPLAALATAAVRAGETRVIPEGWVKTWDHFMDNIRDWCISRQLWWGHRIPVFYDLHALPAAVRAHAAEAGGRTEALALLEAAEALAEGAARDAALRRALSVALNALDDERVRALSTASAHDLAAAEPGRFVQEEDVLDTWFSSGLWPFSTLGWPEQTPDLARFYPGAVLETGFDILFFWVARMMMMGTYFMGKAPFADVYLHAMVRDAQGRKMSKSLGNTIDPLDVIRGVSLDELTAKTRTYPVPEKLLPQVLAGLAQEYPDGIPASGADGLRFTLASLSGQGRDIKLSIPRVAGYRAFLNKIWNATRFGLMRAEGVAARPLHEVRAHLTVADRWVLSRLQAATAKVRDALSGYRFSEAADVIYHFFWSELCDWYIELAKGALSDRAPMAQREAACAVLFSALDQSMRLLHPLCPFQTEEIWQQLPGREARWPAVRFCAEAPYPEADAAWVDEEAEQTMGLLQTTLTLARNARHESGLPIQKKAPLVVVTDSAPLTAALRAHDGELRRLAQLSDLSVFARGAFEAPRQAAINASAEVEVVVLLEGLIDLGAERERLTKELEKLAKQRDALARRVESPGFRDKAPAAVVAETEGKIADADEQIARLRERVAALGA
ncbi:MAG: valine--tRNA ligase, partial [Deltaproteobacteria bacterium]|nr:valine--tRNA ligase [Deltaproteobacteria bacterium]